MSPLMRLAGPLAQLSLPGRLPISVPRLSPDSPAVEAMTDLLRDAPFLTRADRSIHEALQDMIACGVRALLVLDAGAIVGLVTAADLLGERAVIRVHDAPDGGPHGHHADVQVRDVMTPNEELRVLQCATLMNMTIGALEQVFLDESVTHLLVIERRAVDDAAEIRGILSRSRLERHLDRPLRRAA